MSDRWWAPQRATLDPDAVVLAMLEPGDIGSSVLAVHRAGAAAIDTVAKAGLPNEGALAQAMTAVRASVADRVVDSVSKSASPSYAGLFVMDVFDDAEQGAIDLYRTAVAKGVAPPIAVQRVSDVYGVPSSHLGKYLQVATDPRANPVAVRDLADRTLLEYASAVAAAETDDVVSKANEGQYAEGPKKPWHESDVVRDALGRFADEGHQAPRPGTQQWLREQLGLNQTAPEQVAGIPTREERSAPQRQRRTRRLVRTKRAVRRAPVERQAQQQATQRGEVKRVVNRSVNRAQLKRSADIRKVQRHGHQGAVKRAERQQAEAEKKALIKRELPGDLMKTFHGPGEGYYKPLEHAIVLRSGTEDAAKFRVAVREQADQYRDRSQAFRLGHLMSYTGGNTTAERPGTDNDADVLSGVARIARQDVHAAGHELNIDVELYTDRKIEREGGAGRELEYLESEKLGKAGRYKGDLFIPDANEIDFIEKLPVYRPYGVDPTGPNQEDAPSWAIVHFQADEGADPDEDREVPTVDEWVLLNVDGVTEGTLKYEAFDLDKNQTMRLVAPPGEDDPRIRAERYWDAVHKVVVNRWYVEPIAESDLDDLRGDVQKANEGQYAHEHRPWREADVIRDALGRFAEEPSAASEQEATVQRAPTRRIQRTQRARRTVRRAATEAAKPVERAQIKRDVKREARRAPVQRSAFHRAFQRHMARRVLSRAPEAEMPLLSDARRYKALTQRQWDDIAYLIDDEDMAELHANPGGKVHVPLNAVVRRGIAEKREVDVYELPHQMAVHVDDDINLRGKPMDVLNYLPVHQAEDPITLADKIAQIFDDNPAVDKLELIRTGDVVRIAGNRIPAQDQTVIEYDPDIDFDKPLGLTYVGEFRARDMGMRNIRGDIESLISPTGSAHEGDVEGYVASPTVHLYRVKTKHYRAANADTDEDPPNHLFRVR